MHIKVYEKDGPKHIGYFHFLSDPPKYVINDHKVYELILATYMIKNPCYVELGTIVDAELDDDID